MTKIEWAEETWNPIVGCSVISPGCTNCYAMKMAGTRLKHTAAYEGLTRPSKAGPVWNGKLRLVKSALDKPVRWQKPRRIFVNSMGDLFHNSSQRPWIDAIFVVMEEAKHHQFMVLTKRAANMFAYMKARQRRGLRPPPNVILGVSVEDQDRANHRIGWLAQTPAALRFLSCEPLLGPLDLTPYLDGIDWVIVGGESGKGARPMHPDWVRSLRDQCRAAGVPFFFKQWGHWQHGSGFRRDAKAVLPDGYVCDFTKDALIEADRNGRPAKKGELMAPVGKKAAGRLLDGREWNDMPGVTP